MQFPRVQVDAGRLDGLVAEDVGDLLDRRAALHQAGRQRMPKRVHAMAALLADPHVSHPGVLDQDLMQMVLVGERPDRGRRNTCGQPQAGRPWRI